MAEVMTAQKVAASIDPSVIPHQDRGLLTKAKTTIDSAVIGISDFQRLVPVLTELLGSNGRRVYLIEQPNPAELRSGGGFLGTVSVVSADQGTLNLISSGDSYTFDGYLPGQRPYMGDPAYVAPPSFLRGWYSGHSWNFDSEFSGFSFVLSISCSSVESWSI